MKTTLLIMAAGIGSRFGGGIKQLEPVGLHDEIIMDYSIHDAIAAGFGKVVFIIRRDIEEAFRERIGSRIERECARLGVEIGYAYQSMEDIPGELPAGRAKPWGTGQAVLAAKDLLTERFAVINADDYYGKEAFRRIHDFLTAGHPDSACCMAGFILKNTLSENGGVTRGVCRVDENGMLADVRETKNIRPAAGGAEADGAPIDADSYVSMNMWGLTPAFLPMLEEGFVGFFDGIARGAEDPLKGEYLLPEVIDRMLKAGRLTVEVLPTRDRWFGVTYKEDKPTVVESFRRLIAEGVYPEKLYSDL